MRQRQLYSVLILTFVSSYCIFRSQAQVSVAAPSRPPIVGVANIGLEVKHVKAADKFYGHVLGYAHFSRKKYGGSAAATYYKVNDHQYIEVSAASKKAAAGRLTHIAFETTNLQKLQEYLAANDVKVPATVEPGFDKNLRMTVKDPEGHDVEFVEYKPGSLESENFGKLMPETRVSKRMVHVGVTVQNREAMDRFYRDILGFKLMWYGGEKDGDIDWVDMRVPDGTDWLEYVLNVRGPNPEQAGAVQTLALGVDSIQPVYQEVISRGYQPPHEPVIGRNGKWQLALFDPDMTRVEVMEFKTSQKPCCSPMLSPKVSPK